MIEPHIEAFLLAHRETFIKPAEEVAVLLDEHKVSHAKLLLSQYKYTKVPVIDKDKQYIGILGLSEVVEFEMASDFFYEKANQTTVGDIVNKNCETVQDSFTLEEVLSNLVKEPFLPVLKGRLFAGIIPRQEILKAINALAHEFGKYYDIHNKP